jgi:hypothetical protein
MCLCGRRLPSSQIVARPLFLVPCFFRVRVQWLSARV